MTAAQITTAARLIAECDPKQIVTFMEMGSEGSLLRVGERKRVGQFIRFVGDEYLIARNGQWDKRKSD